MLIEDDGRGFRASLDDYDAMLNTGEIVRPDPIVSSWAGNYEDNFDTDLSTEKIFSAGSLNYGLLAFPGLSSEDFVLRNLETGNEFIIKARDTTLGDLIPTIAAPELGPITLSGNDFATTQPILSLGLPLRVTLKTESDRASGFGGVVSLDAEYRRDEASILPESIGLISADLIDCPPCEYSQTVEFTPEYGRVFNFQVLAEGPWTIVVEATG